VDDNPTNLFLFEEILEDNFELKTAESGEIALEKFQEFDPDLVLLDVMMPGLSGYDVCREIRKMDSGNHRKIIMVSAKNQTADRLDGYNAGADDYLTKPFNEDELFAKLEVYLRLKSVEELDQYKTEIMSILCHEARTPLNGVIGPVELMIEDNNRMSEADRLEWLQVISDSANRLLGFVEKSLLVGRIKAGTLDLDYESVSLAKVAREALGKVSGIASRRNIQFAVTDNDAGEIEGDRQYIQLVVDSIVDNAVKYSEDGQSIEVVLSRDDSFASIVVRDSGCGIASSQLEEVFKPFSRAGNDSVADGQCLSLHLSREILRLHQGTINIESEIGEGSVFTVKIPVSRVVH